MILLRTFAAAGMLVVAVAMVVVGAFSGAANAQQSATVSGNNALRISPVRNDLIINPGETKVVELFVQNITGGSANLRGIINDFTVRSGNESGQPDIILDEDKSAPSHGLKQFVSPLSDFKLGPNEQKSIKVTIKVPAGTPGGGYFGAIRFAPAGSNNSQQISLSASVGSLVLVKVPGEVKEQLSIASFDVRRGENSKNASSFYTNKKDLKSVVRFRNEGNVQVEPFGKLVLKDQSGKILSTHEVNHTQPRGNVLPDSIRRFETSLDKVGSFGKYTLEGNFGYGSGGQLLSAKRTFYVVPLGILIAVVAVILLIVLAIFVLPKMLKAYNRSIIRKANKSRR